MNFKILTKKFISIFFLSNTMHSKYNIEQSLAQNVNGTLSLFLASLVNNHLYLLFGCIFIFFPLTISTTSYI